MLILAFRQTQHFLAFHRPCADYQQQFGICFAVSKAKIVVAWVKTMALRALPCHQSGVHPKTPPVGFMAAARLGHYLDLLVWPHAPLFAADGWFILWCLFKCSNKFANTKSSAFPSFAVGVILQEVCGASSSIFYS